jgi:hypothetical protein
VSRLDEPQHALESVWERTKARGREEIEHASRDVERWEWARGDTDWERPEPLWSEMRGVSRSDRTVKPPAGKLGYLTQYGYGADGEIKLARRASGGTAEDPDYREAAVWVTGDSGERLLLEYHSEGIRKPRPFRLQAIAAPVYENGELSAVVRWSGPRTGGSREVYERDGDVITRVTEERYEDGVWRARRTYDCTYSDGTLALITSTPVQPDGTIAGPTVAWRRSSGRAIRDARRRIEGELPDRILQWASRCAPDDTFALALLYSFEGPSVPPAIGAGTERARRELASGVQEASPVWNPAEWEQLDPEPEELLSDGLKACWQLLEQEWKVTASDTEPRALLLKALRKLTPERLESAGLARSVVVFAVDDELVDLDRNLPKAIPAERRRELES